MVISLVFGFLVDLDHFFDYFYAQRRPVFNLREFLETRYWQKSGRLFVFFHGYEYLPLVFLAWQALKGRRWAVAATSAMSSHLLADHLMNELRPFGYFLTYRAAHRFRAAELLDPERVRQGDARRAAYRERARRGEVGLVRRIVNFFV